MKNSKSSLFLMELVIVILFFALSSAVCVQLFVKAHQLDQDTVNLNHSVIWIQNLAETYRAYDGDMQKVTAVYQDQLMESSESSVVLFFDKDWNPISDDAHMIYAAFSVELTPHESAPASSVENTESSYSHGTLKEASINVYDLLNDDSSLLTSQVINCYVPFVTEKGARNE